MPGYPCCCRAPAVANCDAVTALLDSATSVDVTITSMNGTTGCTNCNSAWSGSYNLTPSPFPGFTCPGWGGCFEYTKTASPCGSPVVSSLIFTWACVVFSLTQWRLEYALAGNYAGVWRRQIFIPAPHADVVSGVLAPDSLTGACLPNGNAPFTFNF